MSARDEIQYLVLPDATNPYLLARVRWPDVFHAISPARSDWQRDPGLFDLPYDPISTSITLEQATALAAEWGARLPSDDAPRTHDASLIRRMPANWSNLSPAEKRAWSIDYVKTKSNTKTKTKTETKTKTKAETKTETKTKTKTKATDRAATGDRRDPARDAATSASGRRPWRRRRVSPSLARSEADVIDLTGTADADVLDLTDARDDTRATAEDT